MMLNKTRIKAVLVVSLLVATSAPLPAQQSAYDQLDETVLSKTLRELQMTELLNALVSQPGKGNVVSLTNAAQAKIAEALAQTDQDKRDKALDEAIAMQDRIVEATKAARDPKDMLVHFRATLERVMLEGGTKVDPYFKRLSYFQGKLDDPAKILQFTKTPIELLIKLQGRIQIAHDNWQGNEDALIYGHLDKLTELQLEARYRGAWLRFYRGFALPAGDKQRENLLRQAIGDVGDFANDQDNETGVKFDSISLSGLASRELGEFDNARGFFARLVGTAEVAKEAQLKALFDIAHIWIDQKDWAKGEAAIKDFAERGGKLMGKEGEVAVSMQTALLSSNLYEEWAGQARAKDPAQAARLMGQSVTALTDFCDKFPKFRDSFMEIIATKYEGQDTSKLPVAMKIILMRRASGKGTEEGFTLAEAMGKEILADADKDATPELKAEVLFRMGVIKNQQKQNLPAAKAFRELAEQYPRDKNAYAAARNAYASLRGIMDDRKVEEPKKLGSEFLQEWIKTLEILITHAAKDRTLLDLNYDLALGYEAAERTKDAMAALNRIDPGSELYFPSRFKALVQRVNLLQDDKRSEADRTKVAMELVKELREYRDKAKDFTAADAARQQRVRGWAAECDIQVVYLMREPLNLKDEAVREAEELAGKWKDVAPTMDRRVQEFVIRTLLEERKIDLVIERLKSYSGGGELIADVLNQIWSTIEKLRYDRADPKAVDKLKEYMDTYRKFAEQLYNSAPKDLPAEKMYEYEQALAGALEFGTNEETTKALGMYQALRKTRPSDARNVWGLMRCYMKLGQDKQTVDTLNDLVQNLPDRSPDWWRAQYERLNYFLRTKKDNPQVIKDIQLQIRILRLKDENVGGLVRQFKEVEQEAQKLAPAEPVAKP